MSRNKVPDLNERLSREKETRIIKLFRHGEGYYYRRSGRGETRKMEEGKSKENSAEHDSLIEKTAHLRWSGGKADLREEI